MKRNNNLKFGLSFYLAKLLSLMVSQVQSSIIKYQYNSQHHNLLIPDSL